MNVMAAWVTGATVTVYFVGLVHFQNVRGSNPHVIVPLATGDVTRGTVALEPHRADIVITGFGSTDATACPGTYGRATASSPATCTLKNVSRTTVELPTSTAAFTASTSFDAVPRLEPLCANPPRTIGALKADYKKDGVLNAVYVPLVTGTLEASRNRDAWLTTLRITGAANSFKINGQSVPLADTAEIKIRNEPLRHTHPVVDEAHFFWYYEMYDNAGPCDGLPERMTRAPARSPHGGTSGDHDYASSVGCSNTQYP